MHTHEEDRSVVVRAVELRVRVRGWGQSDTPLEAPSDLQLRLHFLHGAAFMQFNSERPSDVSDSVLDLRKTTPGAGKKANHCGIAVRLRADTLPSASLPAASDRNACNGGDCWNNSSTRI